MRARRKAIGERRLRGPLRRDRHRLDLRDAPRLSAAAATGAGGTTCRDEALELLPHDHLLERLPHELCERHDLLDARRLDAPFTAVAVEDRDRARAHDDRNDQDLARRLPLQIREEHRIEPIARWREL